MGKLLWIVLFCGFGCFTANSQLGLDKASKLHASIDKLLEEGKLEDAQKTCEVALTKNASLEERAWLLNKLGSIQFSNNNLAAAEQYLQQAYLIALNHKHPILLEVLQNKATYYSSIGEHEQAMLALKEALEVAKQWNHPEQIIALCNQLFSNFYSLGQLDSAIHYFNQLIDLKKEGNVNDLMNDWSIIGKLYTEKGDYVLAQRYLTKALRQAELQQDTFVVMSLYTDIATVYGAQKMWERSNFYAQKGIEFARKKTVKLTEAQNLRSQGYSFQQQGLMEAALEKYTMALAIFESLNNSIAVADIHLSIGTIYQKKEDYDKALSNVSEALSVRKGMNDAIGTLHAKLVLSELELQRGYPRKAIPLLADCLAQSQQMDNNNATCQSYLLLSQAYAQLNDYQQSYTNFLKYHTLNDSIISLERSRMVNEIGVLYETEKKDEALLTQKAAIAMKESQIQRRNNQIILLIAFLLLTILSFLLLYLINQRKKIAAEQRLEVLKKEQETQRLRAVIEGEEKERRRIARDLHDDLGALLATVKLNINAIENEIPKIKNQVSYQKAETLIDQACSKVREISHNMIPTILDQHGLEYAIMETCEAISKAHALEIDFIPFGLEHELDTSMKVNIYRIILELLRNVVNHAHAQNVIVQLAIEQDSINLVVEDDGIGFNPKDNSNHGIGLANVKSRVGYLAGEITIDSNQGEGSTFTIHIPLVNVSSNSIP